MIAFILIVGLLALGWITRESDGNPQPYLVWAIAILTVAAAAVQAVVRYHELAYDPLPGEDSPPLGGVPPVPGALQRPDGRNEAASDPANHEGNAT